MTNEVLLYHFAGDDIKVTVEAKFQGESLIIDGYDIGKRVEEYWGDSDYEYTTTIQEAGVMLLYDLLNVKRGEKTALLNELSKRYNTNSCYSEIQKLLDDNKIPYEGFSWR
jgi:hypothetical protein